MQEDMGRMRRNMEVVGPWEKGKSRSRKTWRECVT